jgi:hypothetical protein
MHAAADNRAPGARDQAKTFLRDLLADGKPMLQQEIEELAKAEDIAMKTLRRAKKDLKIRSVKSEKQDGGWEWRWPATTAGKAAS